MSVVLWCTEDNYTYKEVKYSECNINSDMTLEQIVLNLLTNG